MDRDCLWIVYKLVSGISSFQNLCIAAAYRPVEELLEEESKVKLCYFFSIAFG